MRIGLVGTGYWASTVHAVALSREPLVDFVGLWGRDPLRSAELAGELGVRCYADYDEMLSDVDAVSFAVPPEVQADLALTAANSGKHLLLEKPIATSPATARRLEAAVDSAGICSLVFFTIHFDPVRRSWLADLAETGGWRGGWSIWITSAMAPGSPFAASAWRQAKGALWDLGPHALSVLSPVLGNVVEVTADGGAGDLVHLILHHDRGATSTVSLTLGAPPEAGHIGASFWGDSGLSVMPAASLSSEAALQVALRELVEGATAASLEHRCDVHFGRYVVEVLARAEVGLSGEQGDLG